MVINTCTFGIWRMGRTQRIVAPSGEWGWWETDCEPSLHAFLCLDIRTIFTLNEKKNIYTNNHKRKPDARTQHMYHMEPQLSGRSPSGAPHLAHLPQGSGTIGKSLFHPRPSQFRRINPREEGVTCSQPPGLWVPELEPKPQN